ncbi:MAG: dTDP-4-dehydrorhamnose 3,5-epimerase [Rhodocyclaceae bacterium]|nr:dTDP-4-dehydrorhamnose 3,5-epimerase [Rhodocyclaceae bacterium]
MKFTATPIPGVYVVDIQPAEDERGFFARAWCQREMAGQGLCPELAQVSLSFNRHRGTLRGLHYQAAPHGEAKLVRCTRGAMFDVAVDLRPGSPARLRWHGVELSADNRRALYIPEGCAHGFQTLADDTEILYMISTFHHAESARGLRFDDPAIGIPWPLEPRCVSDRDLALPRLA